MDDLSLVRDVNLVRELAHVVKKVSRPIDRLEPLTFYNDEEFLHRYRMTKLAFNKFFSMVIDDIGMDHCIGLPTPPQLQLLITLRYYATGSFQMVGGDLVGVSQPTVSRIVSRVSIALAKLAQLYIRMPATTSELAETKDKFYRLMPDRNPLYKPFPNVIGCVDGCHIPVLAAGVLDRENYRNRKGRISLNVQAVSNADLIFTDVVCRWPGSVHDARIFQNSSLCARLEAKEITGWLLGDSAYSLKPYMMTPLSNPITRADKNY